MPPQGYVLLGGLGWNLGRGLAGKSTVSMFARRHPRATAAVLIGVNAWLVPHLYGRRK